MANNPVEVKIWKSLACTKLSLLTEVMMLKMDNFADWKERVRSDPEKAAHYFLDKVESIFARERKAILGKIPEEKDLETRFHHAARFLHKPLGGVPYLLKDLFDVAGMNTHCGSAFLATATGKPKKSCALYLDLERQGSLFCGKTQMNEFAYGLSGRNDHFGDCPHPKFPDRLSGGSSSGSAWAVGNGVVPLAFGTDTGGSVRVPAAFCGIYGIRLIPGIPWISEGAFPLAPTFDTPGWFTATAQDMRISLNTLISPNTGGRLGRGLYFDGYDDLVEPVLLEKYHAVARHLDLVNNPGHSNILKNVFDDSTRHYKAMVSSESFKNHQKWIDIYRAEYSPRVWERINGGRKRTPRNLSEAKEFLNKLRDAVCELLVEFDYIVMPSTPFPAVEKNGMSEAIREVLLHFTAPGSFAGLPILTIPVFLENGLSGGLQIIYRKSTGDVPLKVLDALTGTDTE